MGAYGRLRSGQSLCPGCPGQPQPQEPSSGGSWAKAAPYRPAEQETRRTNLVWACRDAALLEFYLDKCEFSETAWTLIYYTGKYTDLSLEPSSSLTNPNLLV